jgi:hypothetical protein
MAEVSVTAIDHAVEQIALLNNPESTWWRHYGSNKGNGTLFLQPGE